MLTFEEMKELIHLVASNRLGGVEVREADFHFKVSSVAESLPASASPLESAAAVAVEAAPVPASAEPEVEGHVLQSPIVGTFYASPSPDAEPYVHVGDRVEKGQVVCIVEAMKLMNEIECDVAGVVLKIFAENAHPVEFGERLFCIQTD